MIGWLIIACEIGFWIFVIAGLMTRYLLRKPKAGAFILWGTPIIDLLLIVVTVIDLKNGSEATFVHGLAAYYIGMTIAFGHRMIKWADQRFAHRFLQVPIQTVEKSPREHARAERKGWYRHVLGWLIGNGLLLGMIWVVDNPANINELLSFMQFWLIVLCIDFLWSFSYTVFPKKQETINRH
ncbi:hypothetical protein ACFSCX_25295 [Bacillus salitolerans]|uniref:YmcC n=1 Tax=Bacillus salitolerans TaxID=1437434 RepID=A0ABW4LX67_9BACI